MDTGRFFSTTLGQGPRDVLAIHCTLAHSGAWRGLVRHLDDAVTFHAIDLPTHGRSADWVPGDGDFQDVATAAARDLFNAPMDLVGHSFGGTVALRLAAERPDLVRSLTLIEPVFFAVAVQDAPDVLEAHNTDAEPVFEQLAQGDFPLAARLFNRMWADPSSPRWPELPEATRNAMIRAVPIVPETTDAIFSDRMGLLAPGGLSRITAPTQLLRGAHTHDVIGVINDGLAKRFPNAENVVVAGAGHMLPISHPKETAECMRSIFARAPV